jgi:DNA helicase-2/ATP-dependent DNA helicase PcrA
MTAGVGTAPVAATQGPERLLEDLNAAQQEAVRQTLGPLVILAGAGSGKTRVISRRAAYAVETAAVAADRILLVTFTEKAATEMVQRMAALGHRGVMARTFHAAALAQLRHFWPRRHDGRPLPSVLRSKLALLVPLVGRLPGHYKFTPSRDVADAIEWAMVRRIEPSRWVAEGGERAPLPPDLFAGIYRDYERAKQKADLLDFEDMLVETVRLLEDDPDAAALVQARKTWLSVDEYQDTNPLAERLLELWLGESTDLAVVGDPDQTIYTFSGATPEFLLGFADRHPGAGTVALTENYRSTPEILALANRLVGTGDRGALVATRASGPAPTIRRFADEEAELTAIEAEVIRLAAAGVRLQEMAVLVRINAQIPPLEEALSRAGIAYRSVGVRFHERPEVGQARVLLRRSRFGATGEELVEAVRGLFKERAGLGEDGAGRGNEARERNASLELLLTMLEELVETDAATDLAAFEAELDRRDAAELDSSGDGVNLLTYHRAKGLEWDAVFLPALEEGLLPIRQAKEEDEVAEERRLLYVGITRAREHLALSWAQKRSGQGGKQATRTMSRFLIALEPRRPRPVGASRSFSASPIPSRVLEGALLERLQLWRRERAKADLMPAYVIAHDATLQAIAEQKPRSTAALRRVKGMGPTKVERYGEEILAVVKAAD